MNVPKPLPQNETREPFDAEFNFTTQEEQKHVQWHPFGDAGFVNAYCEVKSHILIRFRIWDGQEFLACVQRHWKPILRSELQDHLFPTGEGERNVMWAERLLNRHFLWSEAMHRAYGADGQEQAVLVNVVEPVKGPERKIPSIVWLDTVERFDRLRLSAVYESTQAGFIGLDGMSYGELDVFGDDGNYPTSEVIESAAQVVQNIARDKRYMSRDRWNLAEVIRQFSSLGIYLSERRDWVRIVKDAQSRIQLLEVLFGPIQLV
jgi:hypothetical protein